MKIFQKYKLGEAVPNEEHSVISNVPTLQNVCDYEEQKPLVMSAMKQGYPRFLRHHIVEECTNAVLLDYGIKASYAVLVSEIKDSLREYILNLATNYCSIKSLKLDRNKYGSSLELFYLEKYVGKMDIKNFKLFFQHSGCEISSRNAKKILNKIRDPKINEKFTDNLNSNASSESVSEMIFDMSPALKEANIVLTNSGMNAFFSSFKALQNIQYKQARKEWIQLGWLYVDSSSILSKYLDKDENLSIIYDITDIDFIIEKIFLLGSKLSGVILECPTNPFCQIADLKRIYNAVHEVGGLLIVDPSIASIYNINCLPYTDLLVCSLTKYAGHNGNLMAGLLAINPKSKYEKNLTEEISNYIVPLFREDLMALRQNLIDSKKCIDEINSNALNLYLHLKKHKKIRAIYSTFESGISQTYLRHPKACGSIISIEIIGEMESFYDRLECVKGPSFGVDFTVVCPYFYLAHYELVQDKSSNNLLDRLVIDRNLIRISVGREPISELIKVFDDALEYA